MTPLTSKSPIDEIRRRLAIGVLRRHSPASAAAAARAFADRPDYQIRRLPKLLELIEEAGSGVELERRLGLVPHHMSFILCGQRPLSEEKVRRWEVILGKPQGWFDR